MSPDDRGVKLYKLEKIDIPKYDSNRNDYRSYIQLYIIKFTQNVDRFPILESQLSYAISRLKPRLLARTILSALVNIDEETRTLTFNKTINTLPKYYAFCRISFSDTDPKATARNKLDKLIQSDSTFTVFLAKFNFYVSILKYGPEVKYDLPIKKVSLKLKDYCVSQEIYLETYPTLYAKFINTNTRVYERISYISKAIGIVARSQFVTYTESANSNNNNNSSSNIGGGDSNSAPRTNT